MKFTLSIFDGDIDTLKHVIKETVDHHMNNIDLKDGYHWSITQGSCGHIEWDINDGLEKRKTKS